MNHFCTYFDHRYLPRALALRESLVRHHGPQVVFHALCLSRQALTTLKSLNLPGVHPIALGDLEAADPALLKAKADRTTVEYYFTCTASLTRHVLTKLPANDVLAYVDADLYFFADTKAIDREMAGDSVYIIEHRYPESIREKYEPYGRFNVGLVAFRHDNAGLACLEDWRRRCLDWCHERLEPDRYADQKYLDAWPERFAGVRVSTNPAENLAPWNLASHRLDYCRKQGVFVDGQPLVFYHFHRLKILGRHLFDAGLEHYGASAILPVVQGIYRPYLVHLQQIMRRQASRHGQQENLRLAQATDWVSCLRQVIHHRPLLALGPMVMCIHGEPWVRPLLKIRESMFKHRAA